VIVLGRLLKARAPGTWPERCWGWCGGQPGRFDAYFWFSGWDCIALGISFCTAGPNFEIHLPFGFIRIGRKPLPEHYDWVADHGGGRRLKLMGRW
jgi:hypothetical protein